MRATAAIHLRSRGLPAAAACALLLSAPVHAGVTNCTVTTTGVSFGTYTPLTTTALQGTGTVAITCTVTSPFNTVTASLTTGASNSYTTRTMTNGTYSLNYNLYTTAAENQIWGNGSGTSVTNTINLFSFGGGTATATATIYGAVTALQDPAAGTYTDSITVSVAF